MRSSVNHMRTICGGKTVPSAASSPTPSRQTRTTFTAAQPSQSAAVPAIAARRGGMAKIASRTGAAAPTSTIAAPNVAAPSMAKTGGLRSFALAMVERQIASITIHANSSAASVALAAAQSV